MAAPCPVPLRLPESFGTLDWYGSGRGESYPDRKDAQHVGRWSGSVDKQRFDYLPPRDNGVKMDTARASATPRTRCSTGTGSGQTDHTNTR